MTATITTTIRDIVAEDFRAAAVFHRHGIDFCCKGDRPLQEACDERGISSAAVMEDIAAACAPDKVGAPRFAEWTPETLIAFIVGNHHAYVRGAIPTLLAHTQKVAKVHGDRHPEVVKIAQLFQGVADEMIGHMFKEERILFPYIAELSAATSQNRPAPPSPFGTVANPIHMMELEHESAGDAMAQIRELSNNYEPPADACATYRVSYAELQEFENDLHAHVHLENNILFPTAVRLERV